MTIVNDYPYNAQKHRLGKLCKRQHDWLGTGQSLRHISSYKCVFCDREYLREWSKVNKTRKRKEITEFTIIEEFDFSSGLHYLGQPCRRKHRYRDSGLSVRLLSNNLCFHCNQEYCRENREKIKARKDKWCLENKDKYQKANRSYYERNKERINRKNVECARRRFSTPEGKEIRSRKYKVYREKNLDSIKARKSAYYQTPKGRLKRRLESKTSRHRRRASCWEKYSLAELQAKYDVFNCCCAYCGKQENLTIEHVIEAP